jgi:hypothetical protein
MNSKITFDIPSHEIDSAKTLVETIDSVELSKREKVVQTYYKNNFKTICNVILSDIKGEKIENARKFFEKMVCLDKYGYKEKIKSDVSRVLDRSETSSEYWSTVAHNVWNKLDKKDKTIIYSDFNKWKKENSYEQAISAALMTVRSDVLAKSYQYDGKVSIPKIICDIIDFKHIIIKDQLIIDTLYYGHMYNVELPNIGYYSLSISDLLYYADNYGCGNIHLSQFEKLKNIISIFVMQLLTPLATSPNASYETREGIITKCNQSCVASKKCNMQCKNQSCLDGGDCPRAEYNFAEHKKTCCLFIKGVLVADFITNVMKNLSYADLLKTYCKLVIPYGSSDVDGSKYITTDMSDVKNKILSTNNEYYSRCLKFMI